MPFDTMSDRLKAVATSALAHCRAKYGQSGLMLDTGIDSSIGWRPTFFLKPSKLRIIAVEVEDLIFPEGLKGAAHDLRHYDFPVAVYQACSLEAYQTDPRHERINRLRDQGFGIMTVSEEGLVVVQHHCIPLMQFISPSEFEKSISSLLPSIKVAQRAAYDVYRTNEGQGLQHAGQIVEAIVQSLAKSASKAGFVTLGAGDPLAVVIDKLYGSQKFEHHRAALGGARDFVKDFRNTASHAPKNAKQAADKIRKCRTGFLDGISVCDKLLAVAKALKLRVVVNLA